MASDSGWGKMLASEHVDESLEKLLMQEDCVELRMLGRPITEGHGWHVMGYGGCEILEYREEGDYIGLRTMRFTRPQGTWTYEHLCSAVALIESVINKRMTAQECEE